MRAVTIMINKSKDLGSQPESRRVEASLFIWLSAFPGASIEKLRRINQASTTSRHIILAITYGLTDRHLASVNKLIIGLMVARHKACRVHDQRLEERIEANLKALHRAINALVGPPPQGTGEAACRSVAGRSRLDRQQQSA